MQIQSGELYKNRTWTYLYPCLKFYGSTLMSYLGSFYKLGVGIGDGNVEMEGNCIYILIDTKANPVGFTLEAYRETISKFLDWVKYQPYYVTDYVFQGLEKNEKHMIVLRVPEQLHKVYNKFTKGRYSEMYSKEEIAKYFAFINISDKNKERELNEKLQVTRAILNKNQNYLPKFLEQVNREFKTSCTIEDFKNAELDYPPIMSQEIFNFKEKQ